MKRTACLFLAALFAGAVLFAGCGEAAGPAPRPASSPEASAPAGRPVSGDEALAIALANADVPESRAQVRKLERDGMSGIPVYDIEFETAYGDYDFEIAQETGEIVGADYEVDEEWVRRQPARPVSPEEAKAIVQSKVPGLPADAIRLRRESGDGYGRYEGRAAFRGMVYEFEMDPGTGILFDWTADLRR